jgi:glycosyltransferase involved in cell wall biosynthesis
MAPSPRRQRVFAIARQVYHALPIAPSTKLKLRRLLVPYLHASAGAADGVGVMKAFSRMKEARNQLEWGGVREAAFRRALILVGAQVAEFGPVSHVIVLPFLATGGAERVALNFAKAVRVAHPDNSVLLVVADRPTVSDRVELPPGVALLSLDSAFDAAANYELKQRLLEDIVVAIRPHVLHNINSEVAWGLILARGERLSHLTRLFASIFAFQFAPNGRTKTGYAAYFLKPGLPSLVGLLTDNQRFVRDAATEYALSASEMEKLHVVYNPVRASGKGVVPPIEIRLEELASRRSDRRLRVLWAGRLDEEKRVDLLVELIEQADFADFDVFGQAVVNAATVLPARANVNFRGAFGAPEELVQDVIYDAFVFTSRWEGMPNILLEVGLLGVPVIAPTVGGVRELINPETGYPLPERPEVSAYLRALEQIRSRPQDAVERARALGRLIERRHSWEAFTAAIGMIPEYLDNQQSVSCREKL